MKSIQDRTMIPVDKKVRNELKKLCIFEGKSYNELLKDLIDYWLMDIEEEEK